MLSQLKETRNQIVLCPWDFLLLRDIGNEHITFHSDQRDFCHVQVNKKDDVLLYVKTNIVKGLLCILFPDVPLV